LESKTAWRAVMPNSDREMTFVVARPAAMERFQGGSSWEKITTVSSRKGTRTGGCTRGRYCGITSRISLSLITCCMLNGRRPPRALPEGLIISLKTFSTTPLLEIRFSQRQPTSLRMLLRILYSESLLGRNYRRPRPIRSPIYPAVNQLTNA
jgi:hypothetical protein